ncbi:hypothetical protein ACQUJS_03080 [Ralstonia pseudosolanacearum]|uniref:Uncharacterized protein n=1 Tax=Ralstonia solanacearum TaxID=305 RepID=A0A0S4TXD8_RALSL|nr:hypothetical protein RSP799_07150 [Ralstonia solanacearum]CUV14648.1 exported protein of unknown function [Ralstonia solanacearum]
MRFLLTATLLLAGLPAHAVDTSVLVYGGSYHFDGPVALPTLGVGYGPLPLEATVAPRKVNSGGVVAFWLRYQF